MLTQSLGINTIINNKSLIEHDTTIGIIVIFQLVLLLTEIVP